jgi:hypothetical protein
MHDPKKRQTAALLTFPPGIKPEEVRDILAERFPLHRRVRVVEVKEYNPTIGTPTIYQP